MILEDIKHKSSFLWEPSEGWVYNEDKNVSVIKSCENERYLKGTAVTYTAALDE